MKTAAPTKPLSVTLLSILAFGLAAAGLLLLFGYGAVVLFLLDGLGPGGPDVRERTAWQTFTKFATEFWPFASAAVLLFSCAFFSARRAQHLRHRYEIT